MLTSVKYKILDLLSSNIEISLDYLAKNTNLKKRALYKNIAEISWDLKSKGLEEIQVNNTNFLLKASQNELNEFYKNIDYFYSQKERENIIIFNAMLEEKNSIDYFVDLFAITRTTILKDINDLNSELEKNNLKIIVKDNVIFIEGDELQKRAKIVYFIFTLNPFTKRYCFIETNNDIEAIVKTISSFEDSWYSDEYINFMKLYFSFLVNYYKKNKFLDLSQDFLTLSQKFFYYKKLVKKLMKIFALENVSEENYLNAILITGNHRKNLFKNKENIFYLASLKYFNKIELESFIFFKDKEKLIEEFSNHLFITYFRLKYYLYESYKDIDIIKDKYQKYFCLAEYNIYILEQELNIKFDHFNLALVSLYIVLYLKINQRNKKINTILIVANNDIYSQILKNNFEYDFPEIEIIKVIKYKSDYDWLSLKNYLIISTQKLPLEQNYLWLKTEGYDKKNIKEYITKYSKNIIHNKKISELVFNNNLVSIIDNDNNWREAIKVGCNKLVKESLVKKDYYKYIIKNVEKFGPYFIVDKDIAICFASFTKKVNKKAVQVTIFKKGFLFPSDNRKIKITLSFSVQGNNMSEEEFTKWMILIGNRSCIDKLTSFSNEEKLFQYINSYLNN